MIHFFHVWSEWQESKRDGCNVHDLRTCYVCQKAAKRIRYEHEEIVKKEGEQEFLGQRIGRVLSWKLYQCVHCGQLRGDSQLCTLWDLT